MKNNIFFAVLLILLALYIVDCGKKEPVVATIGTKRSISEAEFIESFQRGKTKEATKISSLEERLAHLDALINNQILILEAYAGGLDKDTVIVKKMESVHRRLVLDKLYREEILNKTIREVDIREYYARMRKEVDVRHIFFRIPSQITPEEEEEIRNKGEAILERIRSGDKFEELALKFSEDHRTAQKEGYLGTLYWSTTPGPIREAAFSMRPGQVSDLIKNEQGFHIIRVEKIRKTNVKPFADEYDNIKGKLYGESRAKLSENGQMFVKRIRDNKQVEWNQEGLERLKELLKNVRDPKRNVILDTLQIQSDKEKGVVLVNTSEEPFTIQMYLNRLKTVPERNRLLIYETDHIKSTIDQWLVSDFLYEFGINRKLDKDPEVSEKFKEAKESEMSQLLKKLKFQNEPQYSEDNLKTFFEEHINDYYDDSERSKSFNNVKEAVTHDYINFQKELTEKNWFKDKKEKYSVHIDKNRLEHLFESN